MRFRGVHHVEFSVLDYENSITNSPTDYPVYTPGYYAVFFIDPTGILWEFASTPWIPMPWDILKSLKIANELRKQHPEWKHYPTKEMMRKLPSKKMI